MHRLSVLILGISLMVSFPLTSAVRRICKVAYQVQSGWSKDYTMELTFLTGSELNTSTKSYQYNSYDKYVLIWFDEGEVAILKLDDYIIAIDAIFTADNFRKTFEIFSERRATQVNDSEHRKWRIKAKDFFNWIDPRVE